MRYYAIIVFGLTCCINSCASDGYEDEEAKYSQEDARDERNEYFKNTENIRAPDYPPLKEFLERYIKKMNEQENKKHIVEEEKLKSWDKPQASQDRDVYQDRKGWVTLDAVPWSVSKISKWQSKYKPNDDNNWDEIYMESHPDTTSKPPSQYSFYKPNRVTSNPSVTYSSSSDKNDYEIGAKPWYKRPYQQENIRKKEPCNNSNTDIITDGFAPEFPSTYDKLHRRDGIPSSSDPPVTYPSDGEGEWVLLSTTKGYKYPKNKRRSLRITNDTLRTHRKVRLTVLPPLPDSNINMTTSHGGLLEVESTFNTVDQAQKDFQWTERLKNFMRTRKPLKSEVETVESVVSALQKPGDVDSSAVAAAVGAGMIPATMAMLVPMAMNGKRKRSVDSFINKGGTKFYVVQ